MRINEYPVTDSVTDDDYILVDSETSGSRKYKAKGGLGGGGNHVTFDNSGKTLDELYSEYTDIGQHHVTVDEALDSTHDRKANIKYGDLLGLIPFKQYNVEMKTFEEYQNSGFGWPGNFVSFPYPYNGQTYISTASSKPDDAIFFPPVKTRIVNGESVYDSRRYLDYYYTSEPVEGQQDWTSDGYIGSGSTTNYEYPYGMLRGMNMHLSNSRYGNIFFNGMDVCFDLTGSVYSDIIKYGLDSITFHIPPIMIAGHAFDGFDFCPALYDVIPKNIFERTEQGNCFYSPTTKIFNFIGDEYPINKIIKPENVQASLTDYNNSLGVNNLRLYKEQFYPQQIASPRSSGTYNGQYRHIFIVTVLEYTSIYAISLLIMPNKKWVAIRVIPVWYIIRDSFRIDRNQAVFTTNTTSPANYFARMVYITSSDYSNSHTTGLETFSILSGNKSYLARSTQNSSTVYNPYLLTINYTVNPFKKSSVSPIII